MPQLAVNAIAGKLPKSNKACERGWVGIDIGTSAIKLAQVERVGTECHIAARWTVASESEKRLSRDENCDEILKSPLSAIKKLRQLFIARKCAAVLPMSLVDLRTFDIPSGNADEQRGMVAEMLAAEIGLEPNEFVFDFWENGAADGQKTQLTSIAALAVPKHLAASVANHLLSAGMECQTLNGMPWAVARAVELAEARTSEESSLAIDLGCSSPLLVLVDKGRPVFSRVLRCGGINLLMESLQKDLCISMDECQQLLSQFGLPVPGLTPSAVAQRTFQSIASPLHSLVTEIERTTDFLEQQYRSLKPTRVWLLGGGTQIKNLPEYLTHSLRIPTHNWALGNSKHDPVEAVYGIAAALSSLAWEARPCT